jgi:hypothetical protein
VGVFPQAHSGLVRSQQPASLGTLQSARELVRAEPSAPSIATESRLLSDYDVPRGRFLLQVWLTGRWETQKHYLEARGDRDLGDRASFRTIPQRVVVVVRPNFSMR